MEGHRLDVRRRASGHRGRCPSIVFVTYAWRGIVSMSVVVQAVTVDGAPPSCLSRILGGTLSRCPPSLKRSPWTVPLHRVCHVSVEGHRLDVRRRSSGRRGRRPTIVFVTYSWRDIVSMSAVVLSLIVPLKHVELPLVWPIVCVVRQFVSDWIVLNVCPFFAI